MFSGNRLFLHGRNEEIARQLARLPVYLTFVLVENDTICDELGTLASGSPRHYYCR
jgi:hypothetical protein